MNILRPLVLIVAAGSAASRYAGDTPATPPTMYDLVVYGDPASGLLPYIQQVAGLKNGQGDWIYFPKQDSLGYSAPEPERPLGLPWATTGFTNSDIDQRGQTKPGAPPEQLYNLTTDLRQTKNLAVAQPDRVSALRARFLELTGPAAGRKSEVRAPSKEE